MKTSKAKLNQIATYSELNTFLEFSRGVSRGNDTYGYPIIRLTNNNTGEVYKCSGGGYDMHGTNVGTFLKSVVNESPAALQALATAIYNQVQKKEGIPYGLTIRDSEKLKNKEGDFVASKVRKALLEKHFYLDGACGESCMYRIARLIGFDVEEKYVRAKTRKGTDKFLGVDFDVAPDGLLVKYLAKEKLENETK